MKKLIIGGISALVLFTGCSTKKNNNNNNDNKQDENKIEQKEPVSVENDVFNSKEVFLNNNMFSISNATIIYDGNVTHFTSNLTNLSGSIQNLRPITLTLVYLDGNDIEKTISIPIDFGETINPGQTIDTSVMITDYLKNVKSVSYDM